MADLKYLAPYLPWDLILASPKMKSGSRATMVMRGSHLKDSGLSEKLYKPVLRPLSDLVTTFEKGGRTFRLAEQTEKRGVYFEFDEFYTLEEFIQSDVLNNSYYFIELLLEWNFDIFGLIEKGEAIDINTLL